MRSKHTKAARRGHATKPRANRQQVVSKKQAGSAAEIERWPFDGN
jgi:hypothetical protein